MRRDEEIDSLQHQRWSTTATGTRRYGFLDGYEERLDQLLAAA